MRNPSGGYLLVYNDFGLSLSGKIVLIAQSAVRNLILLLVNSIINTLTIIRFRQYIKNKRQMQGLLKNKPNSEGKRSKVFFLFSIFN